MCRAAATAFKTASDASVHERFVVPAQTVSSLVPLGAYAGSTTLRPTATGVCRGCATVLVLFALTVLMPGETTPVDVAGGRDPILDAVRRGRWIGKKPLRRDANRRVSSRSQIGAEDG